VRQAWLSELITTVRIPSRGVYGARRMHAELTLGHGITVGHHAVGC
jgi:putative transposase